MTFMATHGSLSSISGLQVYAHQALTYYWQDYLGIPSKGQWGVSGGQPAAGEHSTRRMPCPGLAKAEGQAPILPSGE